MWELEFVRHPLLARLAEGGREQTVSEVASCCPVDLSVVSRHLRTLREAGIVSADKRGKQVFYRVEVGRITSALRNLADDVVAVHAPGTSLTLPDSAFQAGRYLWAVGLVPEPLRNRG